eukprot:9762803-Lingulodinium_polyedra.AAC.1
MKQHTVHTKTRTQTRTCKQSMKVLAGNLPTRFPAYVFLCAWMDARRERLMRLCLKPVVSAPV